MHCAECERIRSVVHHSNSVLLTLPTDFTRAKVDRLIGEFKLQQRESADPAVVRLTLSAQDLERFVVGLNGMLSSEEQRHARALVLPEGAEPTMQQFLGTMSVQSLIGTVKGRWLVDMIEHDRLFSALQMIIRPDGTLYGHEALLRGSEVDGSVVGAGPLLDAAEGCELLFTLDLAARRQALTAGAKVGGRGLKLFVNFNPSAIYDPAYCLRTTVSYIGDLGLEPEDIVFEVTESTEVVDRSHLRGILAFYRQAGFRIALDDIGAGFSGLNMLRDLGPDIVKLDMGLIRNIDSDPFRQSIVRHLIGIARDTGATALAEGIETAGERDWLVAAGIDLMQGFLFGRPAVP